MATPTQNVQMMKSEPHKEYLNMNMMLRSGASIGEDKGKQREEDAWVHRAPTKKQEVYLERTKQTFMEAKESFMEASTSGRKEKTEPERDTSMLTTFLETCMGQLKDTNVVKGLQELITRCIGSDEPRMVQNFGKHVFHTRWEM